MDFQFNHTIALIPVLIENDIFFTLTTELQAEDLLFISLCVETDVMNFFICVNLFSCQFQWTSFFGLE